MTNPWFAALLVGAGGCVGSITRYGLSLALLRFSHVWPLGTMASNVLGCLLIGLIAGMALRGETLSLEARLVLATGFCGGFTTLSSLIYEVAGMLRGQEFLHAVLYSVGTFLFSLVAFGAGIMVVRLVLRS